MTYAVHARAAEKAARDLIGGPLISAVGDLGEAVTGQRDAAAAVTTAQTAAAELVAAAKRDGVGHVAAAHTAALDAGGHPKHSPTSATHPGQTDPHPTDTINRDADRSDGESATGGDDADHGTDARTVTDLTVIDTVAS